MPASISRARIGFFACSSAGTLRLKATHVCSSHSARCWQRENRGLKSRSPQTLGLFAAVTSPEVKLCQEECNDFRVPTLSIDFAAAAAPPPPGATEWRRRTSAMRSGVLVEAGSNSSAAAAPRSHCGVTVRPRFPRRHADSFIFDDAIGPSGATKHFHVGSRVQGSSGPPLKRFLGPFRQARPQTQDSVSGERVNALCTSRLSNHLCPAPLPTVRERCL